MINTADFIYAYHDDATLVVVYMIAHLFLPQALDKQRIEAAMREQQSEDKKIADALVRKEHHKMLAELEKEKVRWVSVEGNIARCWRSLRRRKSDG